MATIVKPKKKLYIKAGVKTRLIVYLLRSDNSKVPTQDEPSWVVDEPAIAGISSAGPGTQTVILEALAPGTTSGLVTTEVDGDIYEIPIEVTVIPKDATDPATSGSGGLGGDGHVSITYTPTSPSVSQFFDTPGDYDWTVPDGITQINVLTQQGGASGEAGSDHDGIEHAGRGGDGGSQFNDLYDVVPGSIVHVHVPDGDDVGGGISGTGVSFNSNISSNSGVSGQDGEVAPDSASGGAGGASGGGASGGSAGSPGGAGGAGTVAGGGGGGGGSTGGANPSVQGAGGAGAHGFVHITHDGGSSDPVTTDFTGGQALPFEVPLGITSLTLSCQGAGQDGQPGDSEVGGNGGTGGDHCISNNVTVMELQTLLVIVGTRGAANGGASWVTMDDTVVISDVDQLLCFALGGNQSPRTAGSDNIGDTKSLGFIGNAGDDTSGGTGGASDGGSGGAGGTNNGAGADGSVGAGGGGGSRLSFEHGDFTLP